TDPGKQVNEGECTRHGAVLAVHAQYLLKGGNCHCWAAGQALLPARNGFGGGGQPGRQRLLVMRSRACRSRSSGSVVVIPAAFAGNFYGQSVRWYSRRQEPNDHPIETKLGLPRLHNWPDTWTHHGAL